MSILYILILLSAIQRPEISNYIDLFTSTFAIIALYGFSYGKKILFKEAWRTVFVVSVIAEGINGYIQISKYHSMTTLFATLALGLIFVLPIYYAFFQYAFKKRELWN